MKYVANKNVTHKIHNIKFVCVLGGKKSYYFGGFCLRTKWMISSITQIFLTMSIVLLIIAQKFLRRYFNDFQAIFS